TFLEVTSGGESVSRFIDFSDTQGIFFPNELDDTRSAMLAAEFGEITLPPNAIETKFFVTSLVTGRIVLPPDLDVVVRGTFDKGEGDGLINYERGGKVSPGNPEWAFNGINDRFWTRRVEFPIESRVDQVEVELTVTVPEGSSTKANLIEAIPFPNGSVDVTELATASDLGDNFTRVDGFSPTDNLPVSRYHFPATVVEKVRIRLRQRNWVEENGKKVFYYGLQELGLKLVDYDKNFTAGAPFGANNSFVIEIPAPAGYIFANISRITPDPDFSLEDMSKRHVHMRLGTSSDFSTGTLFDSDSQFLPQQTSVPLVAQSATLYAFFQLNYVEESGGSLSPYQVGTTPWVRGLGLTFTLNEI
ncbi:MAG: hypothetical protein ACXABY_06750, partial [Candidatus Thorarchaeota archaeon]